MSEQGKYPSDEEIQSKLKELGFVGHPDAKSTQAALAIKEWLFDLACDWQRELDAKACEDLLPGYGDAIFDAKSEALMDAARFIRDGF